MRSEVCEVAAIAQRHVHAGASVALVLVMKLNLHNSLGLFAALACLAAATGCAPEEQPREQKRATTSAMCGAEDDMDGQDGMGQDESGDGSGDESDLSSGDEGAYADESGDEGSYGDASGDDSGGLDLEHVHLRTNVCTAQNPRGDEPERCANGGFPPSCAVAEQGPSAEDNRAAACQRAQSELQFARSRARIPATPQQNAAIASAIQNVNAFCN